MEVMKMSNRLIPQYSTKLFTEIWEDDKSFKKDLAASPFAGAITVDNQTKLFYLLYAKYGNSPIANRDITQFKYKVFSIIYQYGPTWEKKVSIQDSIRGLTEADLLSGSKAIYNNALNPGTAPGTDTTEELAYINSQNTTNYKRSKMEAYNMQWELLDDSLTARFINRFSVCFKQFVAPERPLIFVDEDEDENE